MKLPMVIWHESPKHTFENQVLPVVIQQLTLNELCQAAKICCRVTGGSQNSKTVFIFEGDGNLQVGAIPWSQAYVGVQRGWRLGQAEALRVLETLAYAFYDYAARECVSFRGLFVPRRPTGRPAKLGVAQTAAERMRAMRARRAAA